MTQNNLVDVCNAATIRPNRYPCHYPRQHGRRRG